MLADSRANVRVSGVTKMLTFDLQPSPISILLFGSDGVAGGQSRDRRFGVRCLPRLATKARHNILYLCAE